MMRKFIYGLVRIFAISSLIFSSCDNFNGSNILEPICANNSESASTETSDSKADRLPGQAEYVTLSGSINMGGAVPKEIAQAMQISNTENDENSSRTAFPSIPTTGITYDVKAVNTADSSESYTGEVLTVDGSLTYRIVIPAAETEKNYKIQVSAVYDSKEILSGESAEFPISRTSTVASKNIVLSADQSSSGYGSINLEIDVSGTGITSCTAFFQGGLHGTFDKDSSDVITVSLGNVLNGCRPASFTFYDASSNILYSFTEIINVFSNLTTNTWVQNGNEPWFVTTGTGASKTTTCRITSAMVDGFKLTQIYVDPSRSTTEGESNYTRESGTFINPCTSFSKAIEKLTDATKDYTIYITGTLTGPQTIPSDIRAKTLTLTGTTGSTRDIFDGNQMGSALTISSSVPVIIRNLMITNGGPSVDGGGINMASGTYVELSDGVIVSGNSVTGRKGGGVYNNGGNLYLNGNAVIGKKGNEIATSSDFGNTVSGSGAGAGIYNGNNGKVLLGYKYDGSAAGKYVAATLEGGVYRNYLANTASSSAYGGGIYNEKGTVMMSGERAYVAYNYAINGAGIALGDSTSASLVMNGGVIEGNQSNSDGAGAGVYCKKGSSITMESGSVIRNNKNAKLGGGVYLDWENCSLTMNGGTIEGNEVNSEGNGGAVYMHGMSSGKSSFKVSGDAYIPCPDGKKKNDVYILDITSITVAGNLSRDYVASISGNSTSVIKTGYAILTNTSGQSYVSSNYKKFRVISNDTKNWAVDSEGKLNIKLIGTKAGPDTVGDIVFNDGSATPYSESLNLTEAQQKAAIAVIFYKGTGLNSVDSEGNPDNSTTRILGVGLVHNTTGLSWCLDTARAYDINITTIQCTISGSGASTMEYAGDKNGSDNFNQIKAMLGINDDTSITGNYPAFEYAINYKNQKIGSESKSRIEGTSFENGWYLPSYAELAEIYKACDNTTIPLNSVIEKCGTDGVQFDMTANHWSSSQYASDNKWACRFHFLWLFDQYDKVNNDSHVCAIREF